MKRLLFEDVYELSTEMLNDATNFSDCVSAICHYDVATALLSELIQSEVPIGQININDYEWDCYDREYLVSIMDGTLYCNPMYGRKKDGYSQDGYLGIYADVAYIHQDCNSALLKYIDCDRIFEFAINDFDEIDFDEDIELSFDLDFECDGDCEGCALFDGNKDENDEEDEGSFYSSSVSVNISKDESGNPDGFTKSWSTTNEDGTFQFTSYTYHCNDRDMLKIMADKFDVEL